MRTCEQFKRSHCILVTGDSSLQAALLRMQMIRLTSTTVPSPRKLVNWLAGMRICRDCSGHLPLHFARRYRINWRRTCRRCSRRRMQWRIRSTRYNVFSRGDEDFRSRHSIFSWSGTPIIFRYKNNLGLKEDYVLN